MYSPWRKDSSPDDGENWSQQIWRIQTNIWTCILVDPESRVLCSPFRSSTCLWTPGPESILTRKLWWGSVPVTWWPMEHHFRTRCDPDRRVTLPTDRSERKHHCIWIHEEAVMEKTASEKRVNGRQRVRQGWEEEEESHQKCVRESSRSRRSIRRKRHGTSIISVFLSHPSVHFACLLHFEMAERRRVAWKEMLSQNWQKSKVQLLWDLVYVLWCQTGERRRREVQMCTSRCIRRAKRMRKFTGWMKRIASGKKIECRLVYRFKNKWEVIKKPDGDVGMWVQKKRNERNCFAWKKGAWVEWKKRWLTVELTHSGR